MNTSKWKSLRNKVYQMLKKQTLLGIPFFGSLWFIISLIAGFNSETLLGALLILLFILGLMVKFGNGDYDGQIVITTTDEGKKMFSLELDKEPSDIEFMEIVSFKVSNKSNMGYEEM